MEKTDLHIKESVLCWGEIPADFYIESEVNFLKWRKMFFKGVSYVSVKRPRTYKINTVIDYGPWSVRGQFQTKAHTSRSKFALI